MWADWYGFKMESYDAINENIPLVHNAGACAIVHSDDANGIQRLNQEAAKALADGRRAGHQHQRRGRLDLAQRSIRPRRSASPTRPAACKPGKMADVVLWNGNPFSVYTRPERVWIDGALMYDTNDPQAPPGQRLRARPARRRRREVIRARSSPRCCSPPAAPAAAQTIAITGGTVALGRRHRADPGRHGRDPRRAHRRRRRRRRASRPGATSSTRPANG